VARGATSRDIFRPPYAARRAFNDVIKRVGSRICAALKARKNDQSGCRASVRARCFRRSAIVGVREPSVVDGRRYSAVSLNDIVTAGYRE